MRISLHTRECIRKCIGSFDAVVPLAGDASMREYFRIFRGDASLILCIDAAFRGASLDTYPFCVVQKLYREHGIPVPDIVDADTDEGFLLLSDLGDLPLEDAVCRLSRDELQSVYERLLEIIVSIQAIPRGTGGIPFSLSFDMDKLMFEFDFFITHALGAYFQVPPDDAVAALRGEFSRIAALLVKPESFVLAHRDYHCRNVMLVNGSPCIIDFQDSRMGLPQYDVVSLLRDSYVRLDDPLFARLKRRYYDISYGRIHTMALGEYEYYFDLMAFQRNVKALGTFGYQVTALKRAHYENYIKNTARYLGGYISRRDELKPAGALLRPYLGDDW